MVGDECIGSFETEEDVAGEIHKFRDSSDALPLAVFEGESDDAVYAVVFHGLTTLFIQEYLHD